MGAEQVRAPAAGLDGGEQQAASGTRPAPARLAIVAGLVLAALGAVPLIGWTVGLRPLTMWLFDRAPVRPGIALVFVLIGVHAARTRGLLGHWGRRIISTGVLGVGLFGLMSTITGIDMPWDGWILGHRDWYDAGAGSDRMPLLTAITTTALGAAVALSRYCQRWTHALLVGTLFAAYTSLLGQIFGAPVVADLGNPAVMPTTTALGIGLAAVAVAVGTPPRGLLRYLTDRRSAGVLVRPVVVVVPIALPAVAWALLLAHEAGYLDHATVIALVAASGLLIATALAWWAAAHLRELEDARAGAYRRLAATNAELEQRVSERTAEVERRTALFTLAFESASVGMALLDLSGQIVRANRALTAMTGIDATALATARFASLLHPDDRPVAEEQRRLMTSGRSSDCAEELRLTAGHGRFRWVTAAGSVLRDAENAPLQILIHVTDIDERKSQEHRLAHLANHDPLTGLLNRRGFTPLLDAQVAAAARGRHACALLAIDLDNFKSVNDICGHERGDELLIAVAGALQRSLRAGDSVARIGGDEFVALLPGAGAAAATRVAQTLIDAVRAVCAPLSAARGIAVSASVGIAIVGSSSSSLSPSLSPSGTEALRRADRAMYAAKDAGRGRWMLDDPPHVPQRDESPA